MKITDQRMMSSFPLLTGSLALIMSLKPRTLNQTGLPSEVGFLAQEIFALLPSIVTRDASDDGTGSMPPAGKPFWSLPDYWEWLSARAVNAIQELKGLIDYATPTRFDATITDVTGAATGVSKTVATLSITTPGRFLIFSKCAFQTTGVPVSLGPCEVSVSQTNDTHELGNRVRDNSTLLASTRLISADPYFAAVPTASVGTPKNFYMIMSSQWTGTSAPKTIGAESEFYAIRFANF